MRLLIEDYSGILLAIFIVSLLLWFYIADRYWYFWFEERRIVERWQQRWQVALGRRERCYDEWCQRAIQRCYVSRFKQATCANIALMKTLISVSTLLGLLGTVYGMIGVFDSLVFTSSMGIRGLAEQVGKTIVPAASGLMVSLSGLYFVIHIDKKAQRSIHSFAHQLSLHGS